MFGTCTNNKEQAEERRTDEDLVVSVGRSLTLKTDSGCTFTLHESGHVVLQDAYSHKWTLGGAGGIGKIGLKSNL